MDTIGTMGKAELEQEAIRLGNIQPWWHDIELPHGVRTIGRTKADQEVNHNEIKWRKIKDFLDVAGRSVLDLGCNEGYYCHELVAGGASRVVGIDLNSHRIEKARFAAKAKQLSQISFVEGSVYDYRLEDIGGHCDIVLALGMLHRLPDPYTFLVKMATSGSTVILEWSALNSEEPLMKFWGGGYKNYDAHNTGYWKMSRRCVKEILAREGFHYFNDIEATSDRAILAATNSTDLTAVKGPWHSLDYPTPIPHAKHRPTHHKSMASKMRRAFGFK